MKSCFGIILIVFLILFVNITVFAGDVDDITGNPVFQRITTENGLSQGSINTIAEDALGFLWFGTNDGLNRYDGYTMKVYKNQPGNDRSISSNLISDLVFDHQGRLWIATGNGLNCYFTETDNFRHIHLQTKGKDQIISDLDFDPYGNLWIATSSSGLIRLDTSTMSVKRFNNTPEDPKSLSSDEVICVHADFNGNIWVSTRDGGIDYLPKNTRSFTRFREIQDDPKSISNRIVNWIEEDENGNLWLATYGRGLVYLDRRRMAFTNYEYLLPFKKYDLHSILSLEIQGSDTLWIGSESDGLLCYRISEKKLTDFHQGHTENNILYHSVSSLFLDSNKNLWIGTKGKGINTLSPYSKQFYSITDKEHAELRLDFSSVRGIFEDENHILWVGGYQGLQKIDLAKRTSELVGDRYIYALCPDPNDKNILWIGDEGSGLWYLNKKTDEIRQISYDTSWYTASNNEAQFGLRIFEITKGPDNLLYIGTDFGMNIFDPVSGRVEYIRNIPGKTGSLVHGSIISIYFDRNGTLWAGSISGGLCRFDAENNTFISYQASDQTHSLQSNRINCTYEDSRGRLWIATSMGLSLMQDISGKFKTYNQSDGIANDFVYGILEDASGHLWLSTNRGLSRFDPDNEKFINFNNQDGLPGNEFNTAAYFKYNNSRLYFGGVDGLVVFNPQNIRLNPNPPNVVFTNLVVYTSDENHTLNIAYKNRIALPPGVKMVQLEFSALDFINPASCNYAYRIGEASEKWIHLDDNRSIVLANPKHGNYPIYVKATNNDGIWSDNPSVFHISIEPRFYQTAWFNTALIVFGLGLVFLVYIIRINIIKRQRNKLKKMVEEKTLELSETNTKLKSANLTKDKFVSIIAHDLKNPFNSLIGFSDILLQDWDELPDREKIDIIEIMKNTSDDTFQLLVNLLDWSRIQKEHIDFDPENFNLNQLVYNTYYQVKSHALLKNQLVKIEVPSAIQVFADKNMITTIVRNLLSNAIKYTPRNGRITVSAEEKGSMVQCCVKDTGVGIPKDEIAGLFETELPVSSKGTEGESGTGLGLILCREFVKNNNGKIHAESEPGKGSIFCFTIPLARKEKTTTALKHQGQSRGSGSG